jgi:Xaa-Pro aminopeptidase
MTEYTIGKKLGEFRAEGENFIGESFGAIVGFKENGAIVHYEADEETAAEVTADGLLLIDSGGQYLDGTTDITRMFYLGDEANDEEKTDYTNVLKGMISLSLAKFPQGTRGAQLDVLARQFIWANGKNYMHGTGHGVGCFLNVHEGPQSIRMEENPVILAEGMILSNEPGTYIEGKHGIRIENLIQVAEDAETDFGQFMKFETLTVCPIDTKAIDIEVMAPEHIAWLNQYHLHVFETLSPLMNEEEKEFLRNKTLSI